MRIEVNGETAYCYTNSRDVEGDKPTVMFIHGSGMDHTVWTLASRHCHIRRIMLTGSAISTLSICAATFAISRWC